MKPVTLRDIANLTNLDASTVSRVLNNDMALRIAPSRREEVLGVAQKLGYVPHRSARALRLNRSFNIGYVLMTLESPHARFRLYGITENLDQRGYLISLLRANPTSDFLDKRVLQRQSVEGLIWDCYTSSPEQDARLLRTDLPIVLLDPFGLRGRTIANASYVYADRAAGVRHAIEYLQTRGHRAVAFISARTNELRFNGYRTAVQDLGLSADPRLVRLFDYTTEDINIVRGCGYHMARELLNSGVPFTAVQAGNDTTAAGVIDALREAGKRVPDDIAVMGYDDLESQNSILFSAPFLSTVRDPNLEMGVKASELLIAMIEEHAQPQSITLQPELVLRHSA